jgi:hypothetical protein
MYKKTEKHKNNCDKITIKRTKARANAHQACVRYFPKTHFVKSAKNMAAMFLCPRKTVFLPLKKHFHGETLDNKKEA